MGCNVYNTKYDVIYDVLKPEVIHNFLSKYEIDEIINNDNVKFKPAEIVGEHHHSLSEEVRKCDIHSLNLDDYDWLREKIFKRVKDVIKKSDFPDIDINHVNQIDLLRYKGGGNYIWHKDGHLENNTSRYQRKFTIVIQLSEYDDDYTGGFLKIQDYPEISTPTDNKFPVKGSVVIFPSFLEHTVTPVTSGTRYAIVAWAEGPYWR